MVDQVDTEKRQAGIEKREEGAMNGAGQRSAYPQHIPVKFPRHSSENIKKQRGCKNHLSYLCGMSRKRVFYISFFIVLALSFYFILTALVPELGRKRIPPVSYVRDFSFLDQDGETLTRADMEGKVYVAQYFFTSCRGICPDMNNNMRRVYEGLKEAPDFVILSHTSDPETDSVPVLKHFADSMKVNTDKWIFLTGTKDSLYNMARLSYTIDDPANNLKDIDDDFLHTQFWALVDRKGNVRKIYDGLKKSEVNALVRDARRLLKEKI